MNSAILLLFEAYAELQDGTRETSLTCEDTVVDLAVKEFCISLFVPPIFCDMEFFPHPSRCRCSPLVNLPV